MVGYSTQSRSRTGIEEPQNSYLTGSNADLSTILDTVGDRLKGTTIKGNGVVLTIHPGAQWLAQNLLAGKCGAAVVLNPKTGAVDVMASTPGYDPNLIEQPTGYAKVEATKSPCPPETAAPLLNRATQGLYPPGSTFKTITAAAALDDGVYKPNSTFDDPGYCTEYGKQITTRSTRAGRRPSGGQPRRGLPALDQRRLLQHRQEARREADPRRGEEVRLLLGAAARDARRRALGLGPLR